MAIQRHLDLFTMCMNTKQQGTQHWRLCLADDIDTGYNSKQHLPFSAGSPFLAVAAFPIVYMLGRRHKPLHSVSSVILSTGTTTYT